MNWVFKERKYWESLSHNEERIVQIMNEYSRGLCGGVAGRYLSLNLFVIPWLPRRCSGSGEGWKSQGVVSVSWVPASLLVTQLWLLVWDQLCLKMMDLMPTFTRLVCGSSCCLGEVGNKSSFLDVELFLHLSGWKEEVAGVKERQNNCEKWDLHRDHGTEGRQLERRQ